MEISRLRAVFCVLKAFLPVHHPARWRCRPEPVQRLACALAVVGFVNAAGRCASGQVHCSMRGQHCADIERGVLSGSESVDRPGNDGTPPRKEVSHGLGCRHRERSVVHAVSRVRVPAMTVRLGSNRNANLLARASGNAVEIRLHADRL